MKDNFDFIEFWAKEFNKNPKKNRAILNKFINSQISIAQKRLKKLKPEKLIKIFNIKNEKVIEMIYKRSQMK